MSIAPVKSNPDSLTQNTNIKKKEEMKVNPKGIRKLDPERIRELLFKRKGIETKSDIAIASLIHAIVAADNKRRIEEHPEEKVQVKPIQYTDWQSATHHDFEILNYSIKFKGERKIAKEHKQHGVQDNLGELRREYFSFFFREKDRLIFAVTEGSTWEILKVYTDYSWPQLFCRCFLDPKRVKQVKRESIFGEARMTEITYDEPKRLELLEGRNCLYTKICLPFSKDASLYQLSPFQNQDGTRPSIDISVNIRVGQIRINKSTKLDDYPLILNHINQKTSQQIPLEKSNQFELLDYLQKIDDRLEYCRFEQCILERIAQILKENAKCSYSLNHNRVADALESENWQLKYGNQKHDLTVYITINELLEKIRKMMPNLKAASFDDIITEIRKIKLSYDTQHFYPFIDFIEGELLIEDTLYFRINKCFYKLSGDYISLIHIDFRRSLEKLLLHNAHEGALHLDWEQNMSEGGYNEKYLKEKNFIVGDRITPFGIELFDLIKTIGDTTYIYHVKEGFDQHARDAFDQLMNSVEMIYEATHSNAQTTALDKWYDLVTTYKGESQYKNILKNQIEMIGLEGFKECFLGKKLVFIYAVLDKHKLEKLLGDEIKRKTAFSISDFETLVKDSKETQATACQIFKSLKKYNYIDEKGRLTATFYVTKKNEFKIGFKDINAAVRKILKAHASQFKSMIALLSLRRLREKIKEFNFDFKICQIQGESKSQAGSSVPSVPFDKAGELPNLPEDTIRTLKVPVPFAAEDFNNVYKGFSGEEILDALVKAEYLDDKKYFSKGKITQSDFKEKFVCAIHIVETDTIEINATCKKSIFSILKNRKPVNKKSFKGCCNKYSEEEIFQSLIEANVLNNSGTIEKFPKEVTSQQSFADQYKLFITRNSSKPKSLPNTAKNNVLKILQEKSIQEIHLKKQSDTEKGEESLLHAVNGESDKGKWLFLPKNKISPTEDYFNRLNGGDQKNTEKKSFGQEDLEQVAQAYEKSILFFSPFTPEPQYINKNGKEIVYIELDGCGDFSRLNICEAELETKIKPDSFDYPETTSDKKPKIPAKNSQIFYSYNDQKFEKKRETLGDGACGLHALNGCIESSNGKYVFSAKNKETTIQRRAKLDFLDKLDQATQNDSDTWWDKIFCFDEEQKKYPYTLESLFFICLDEFMIEQEGQNWDINCKFSSPKKKKEYLGNQWNRYFEEVKESDYYLSDNELKLAAYLYDKKIILFSESQVIQEFNLDAKKGCIYILHEGIHYSRLE